MRERLAALPSFVRLWLGDVSWTQALRSGDLVVDGPTSVRRGLPRWLTLSDFAAVPRQRTAPGREQALTGP